MGKNNILKCIRYSCFVFAIVCLGIGCILKNFNWILFCDVFLLAQNIFYALEKIKSRILFLAFQAMMYLFLLSRPTIGFMRGSNWQYEGTGQMIFSLGSIGISLFFMLMGAIFWENYRERNKKVVVTRTIEEKTEYKERYIKIIRYLSLILYVLGMMAYIYMQMDKAIFMHGKDYLAYYTEYKAEVNYFIYLLASYMQTALVIYLATLPPKTPTFWALSIFLLAEIPVLTFGKRSQIMLNAIFILMYYFIRDYIGDEKKWIGKVERTLLIICIPICVILLGTMNYTRSGKAVEMSMFALVVDFFFKQGVSFNVLNIAYEAIPLLPKHTISLYSIGDFLDYFIHGTFAQKFFGTSDLGAGNNIVKATEGHNFAHAMSYVTRGQGYLDGNGWGSSYLLETYADFGWIGIILYSILLGVLLIALTDIIKKRNIFSVIALISLVNLYFTPRAGATEFLTIIVKPKFWMPVLVCYIGAGMLCRFYSYRSLKIDNSRKG